jgi:hypothetical protein
MVYLSFVFALGAVGLFGLVWLGAQKLSELEAIREWARVSLDIHETRRHALMLDLLTALRAFTLENRDTIEGFAITRAAAMRAATRQARRLAEVRLDDGVGRLLDIAQSSEILAASAVFSELRAEIEQNQADVVTAREIFAVACRDYDRARRLMPGARLAMRLRRLDRAGHGFDRDCTHAESAAPAQA